MSIFPEIQNSLMFILISSYLATSLEVTVKETISLFLQIELFKFLRPSSTIHWSRDDFVMTPASNRFSESNSSRPIFHTSILCE